MPELEVATPEGVLLRRTLAGAGSRFCAAAFDGTLLALALVAVVLAAAIAAEIDPTGVSGFVYGMIAGAGVLLLIGYVLGFALLWNGQTPGKRLLGLRVVSADGWPASPWQHLMRSLILPLDALLPVPVPFGLLGLVLVASTERRQRLGDLVAGTVVLRDGARPAAPEPFAGQRWSQLPQRKLALTAGLAARLDEADREFLRELLTRRGLDPDQRRRLIVAAARDFARRLELQGMPAPEVALKEIYLYLREARESRATAAR
jgi:uncharacterized RDD family membrane protein YckC